VEEQLVLPLRSPPNFPAEFERFCAVCGQGYWHHEWRGSCCPGCRGDVKFVNRVWPVLHHIEWERIDAIQKLLEQHKSISARDLNRQLQLVERLMVYEDEGARWRTLIGSAGQLGAMARKCGAGMEQWSWASGIPSQLAFVGTRDLKTLRPLCDV
jgi:hypothetical protein